jgi:hypothetical protein
VNSFFGSRTAAVKKQNTLLPEVPLTSVPEVPPWLTQWYLKYYVTRVPRVPLFIDIQGGHPIHKCDGCQRCIGQPRDGHLSSVRSTPLCTGLARAPFGHTRIEYDTEQRKEREVKRYVISALRPVRSGPETSKEFQDCYETCTSRAHGAQAARSLGQTEAHFRLVSNEEE